MEIWAAIARQRCPQTLDSRRHCGGPHSISSVLRLIVPAHNLCRGKLCLPIHCFCSNLGWRRGEKELVMLKMESLETWGGVSTATVGVCEAAWVRAAPRLYTGCNNPPPLCCYRLFTSRDKQLNLRHNFSTLKCLDGGFKIRNLSLISDSQMARIVK